MTSTNSDRELDYNVYAGKLFDLTNRDNEAYWELAHILCDWLPKFELGSHPQILDLGAGTGNFTLSMHSSLPEASYTHVDMSPEMNCVASAKYEEAGVRNIKVVQSMIQAAPFEKDQFDLIVCINALNTAPPQGATLQAIREWLKPGGSLFLVDFGREMNILSWTAYLVGSNIKKHGIRYTANWFGECFESVRQNRKARKDQDRGSMWLHSTEELAELVEEIGLNVVHSTPCYRNCSDLVIATKP